MKPIPMKIVHVDLSKVREGPEGDGRAQLAVLWWRDLPLGMISGSADEVPFSQATIEAHFKRMAAEQRAARDPRLGAPLRGSSDGIPEHALRLSEAREAREAHGTIDWLDGVSVLPVRSADQLAVIICTRDRGDALARCLESILAQRSPPGEIIVVDNSRDGNARRICEPYATVRYVNEVEPGLSRARNAGIRAAARPLIAFTDDDVKPHPLWTSEVVRALEESGADAMTGLVLPSRLDTPAQVFFQMRMGGFGDRFIPMLFDSHLYEKTRREGAHVWRIGAGANMAFRKSVFERLGLFDPRLGAGASGCSEDSEMWYRIIATGGRCQYEPRALVYHDHRDTWPALHRQMRAYLKGHVSALVAQADRFGERGNLRRIYRQLPRYLFRELLSSFESGEKERRRVLLEEFLGWCAGLRYLTMRNWRRNVPDISFETGGGND